MNYSEQCVLRALPVRLKNNSDNAIRYYMENGEFVEKKFSQIHDDILIIIEKFAKLNIYCGSGDYVLIMGNPSYEWVVAALAGFYMGKKVIAFPETLSDEEAINCLTGLHFSICFIDEKYNNYVAFEGHTKILLSNMLTEELELKDNYIISEIPQPKLVAFTSGTTSALKLKAFEINTESTEHFCHSFVSIYGLSHNDTWVVSHSFTHIVHFEYILSCLGWGMNIAIVTPTYLIWNFKKLSPSVVVTVPVVYQQLATFIRAKLPKSGKRADELDQHFLQNITENNGKTFLYKLLPEVKDILGDTLKMMLIGSAPSSDELKRFLLLCGLPIFEGYGLSETNMLTCNTPNEYYFGSVGVAWPGVNLKVENKELKVKLDFERSYGYLNADKDEQKEVYEDTGWINTGDVSLLKGNYVFVSGRTKDTIITDRGKNINPNPIEEKICYGLNAAHVVLYGDNRSYIIAIIALKSNQILDNKEISDVLNDINTSISEHEKIKNYVITKDEWTIENGLVTRSGKVRRKLIWEKYRSEIEECYE